MSPRPAWVTYSVHDAFASRAFQGNPVAVVMEAAQIDDETAQLIARHFNLSETTFVDAVSDRVAKVRIFTPVNQLPLAGHPLMGTAAAIAGETEWDHFVIETQKARITARIDGPRVCISQPAGAGFAYPRESEALAALGLPVSYGPAMVYDVGPRHYLVGLSSRKELDSLRPDLLRLADHENLAFICHSVEYDMAFVRMFSPAYGVAEDPATGSAAVPLLSHLQANYAYEGTSILIRQGVAMGRESHITVHHDHGSPLGSISGDVRLRMEGRLALGDVG